MFPLAHLAAGYLLGRLWNMTVRKYPVNPLLTTLGGMLPDLIDKPLSYVPGNDSGRAFAHTLLFTMILFALTTTRFSRTFLALALGTTTHLFLDDPGEYLATLFWPLLGTEFTPNDNMSLDALIGYVTIPRTGFMEILGGLFLLAAMGQHVWSTVRPRHPAPVVAQTGRPLLPPGLDEPRPTPMTDAD